MNLLTLVQSFCARTKLPVPGQVIGSSDPQVLQIQGLLEEGGADLADRGDWQELNREATWTTLANEDQGLITTLAPFGYKSLLPQTLWDRTALLPLLGPSSPSTWATEEALVIKGPRYSFRLRGNHFLSIPAPPAGSTWAFEYTSESWVSNAAGTVFSDTFSADTDIILLRSKIVMADLRWRWKKEKGVPYGEDFNSCERLVNNALGRSANVGILRTDNRPNDPRPGIFVPIGSWSL